MRVGIGHIHRGIGQSGSTYTDPAGSMCNPANVNPTTGFCLNAEAEQAAPTLPSETPYQCNWLQNFLSPSACASAASPTPPVPTPPPPPATVGSSCAPNTSLDDGSCSISGHDSNGNPIYVSAPQGAAYHAYVVQDITAQVAAGYVDCSTLWNQLFNSQCPCTLCSNTTTWLVLGVAGLGALFVLGKVLR